MRLLLFVYGTLSPDLAPPALLPFVKRLREVGQASIAGTMYDLGQYPGVIETRATENPPHRVHGRLYELSDSGREAEKLLAKFDEYEGFDPAQPERSLFVRRLVRAYLPGGEQFDCWAYFYNRPVDAAKEIPGGIYSPKNR